MKRFTDKLAIVTGGNSGIGYATAKALINEGAKVIITGRRKEAVEKAATELGAIPFVTDQASLQDIQQLKTHIEANYGKVDILFVNAGITGTRGPIETTSIENFDNVMNINFRGAYFTLQQFIPLLKDGASVVMLSSIVANMHSANSSVYQASKAALNSISKTAANELAARRIRVNMVSPGPTRTEVLGKAGLDPAGVEALYETLQEKIPLKQIGTAEHVAQMVCYLSSAEASFITGSEFVLDGGMTL
ncbi:SDR family oxidoreductase [Pseudobacter ginsenosidimutans]|uniref:NAD(P)-dependent dehydrogenase (Short-subunit alcohol dehydrogenase family) n=1 Tax=Pseudobacter ginsenosidimutans TaxID=661488 RepID=A0A4Q7N3M3_9BACT|nr:SDR family oxidoreductase [Pseudobacter ginsenosidimutans]QEC44059.1 SDR family oxidoreductase [Pseudobacter ginsenosidimutans]RZS75498.1 NAD(P)-dependent dehydrogenase (short-subunit alcohol dehydrogenase family) [Pseudobacter ginsenosidimutans]